MTARELIPPDDLPGVLQQIPDWHCDGQRLEREFSFPDFVGAFGFMCSVALVAQRLDHHPDWWNSYGSVRVQLRTHDLGGISTRDIALARRIDVLAQTSGTARVGGTPSAGK